MGIFVKSGETSPFLWLGIPIVLILMSIGIELSFTGETLRAMYTEGGPIEITQFVFMAAATILAAIRFFQLEDKYLKIWATLIFFGSLYIAGEEISWGQWLFYWDTPEFWAQVNDQQETNLHNTSAWLDQKPRLLMFIGIVIGGLLIPALRRWKPSALPTRFSALYPADHTFVTALGVLIPYAIQEVGEHFLKFRLFERVSEVQEMYIYFFILLYIFDLRKLKKSQA